MRTITSFSRLTHILTHRRPQHIIATSAKEKGTVALSSFGIQSGVLLHMLSQQQERIPVIMVDTGYLFEETYKYAEQMTQLFDLHLEVARSPMTAARMEAIYGKLWESESPEAHNLYGALRKVAPAKAMFDKLGARIVLSGIRASQTKHRASVSQVSPEGPHLKVFPLLYMSDQEVEDYMKQYKIPPHPLQSKGYTSVGDWHSSRPAKAGEDPRATRFGGKFQECGLHVVQESSSLEQVLRLLSSTTPHKSGITTHIISKEHKGKPCSKCRQISEKLQKASLEQYIGGKTVSRTNDDEGAQIAAHFNETRAPIFIYKIGNEDWQSTTQYGKWKKVVLKHQKS